MERKCHDDTSTGSSAGRNHVAPEEAQQYQQGGTTDSQRPEAEESYSLIPAHTSATNSFSVAADATSVSALVRQHINQLTSEPGKHDVLLGRGGETNNHCGNIKFRQLVLEYRDAYRDASKVDKPAVARKLVAHWRSLNPPGRFLAKTAITTSARTSMIDEHSGSLWVDVGDKAAQRRASKNLGERDRKNPAPNASGSNIAATPKPMPVAKHPSLTDGLGIAGGPTNSDTSQGRNQPSNCSNVAGATTLQSSAKVPALSVVADASVAAFHWRKSKEVVDMEFSHMRAGVYNHTTFDSQDAMLWQLYNFSDQVDHDDRVPQGDAGTSTTSIAIPSEHNAKTKEPSNGQWSSWPEENCGDLLAVSDADHSSGSFRDEQAQYSINYFNDTTISRSTPSATSTTHSSTTSSVGNDEAIDAVDNNTSGPNGANGTLSILRGVLPTAADLARSTFSSGSDMSSEPEEQARDTKKWRRGKAGSSF